MLLSNTINPATLNWKARTYDPDASMDKAMRQTDWPALCQLATNLRGVSCVPLDYATNGLNNMARLLQFKDGVLWVARVAMRRSAADTAKLRSEVDAMLWIRQQSSLPVPEIFAYEVDVDEHNAVGVPFVLMSFVPGNTAMDVGGGYETHHGIIPAAHRPRFYRAVAACHVQMTSLRLPKIGTIRRTPDGAFEAGPIPGIGGPFDTATAFFEAWADHAQFPRRPDEILDTMHGAPEAEQVLCAVDNFLSRFRTVAPRLVRRNQHSDRDRGPFPLCHPDFLHSNIIEGACTLPLELVRFPRFLDAMPRRFGRSDDYGADGKPHDEDERQRWCERREYVQMVAALEALERGPGVGAGRGDHTLSSCLADEHAQDLSYAMGAFEGGKMGVYDQLLDGLEERLPLRGEPL
ncbi:Aminoglycoside phosphotransferase [Niveomyces insectorum RCEF 264]|uniref:Aminoglycoside phosphotransferase n=1 Tax=Niveomyces insectorum RCEF 264 TaxID=1081102 RepID=A0A167N2W7_9HYPO|nr:Aminoglycoside phosphotransferase [Niveomyces insectorum RCEF 264]